MTNENIKQAISQIDSDSVFKDGTQFLEITVSAGKLHEVCTKLKNNADTAFDYLACLTGVDYPNYFEIVYHLSSTTHHQMLVLHARTENRENPTIDTVGDIWPTAYAHEREVYDLLGVKFNNNPNMRRLFLEDGWGFPLRKDYVDPVRVIER